MNLHCICVNIIEITDTFTIVSILLNVQIHLQWDMVHISEIKFQWKFIYFLCEIKYLYIIQQALEMTAKVFTCNFNTQLVDMQGKDHKLFSEILLI